MIEYFRKEIGTEGKQVVVTSCDPATFMNVWLYGGGSNYVSLPQSDAKLLRDALIEAYPVEAAKPEASEYKVRESRRLTPVLGSYKSVDDWTVYRDVPTMKYEDVAHAENETAALKVAKALNEAEGL